MVSECFFRDKYVLIIISTVYAQTWWVTWPFSHYELENGQFDHFIGDFFPISGLIISLSRNIYFWNQWLLDFNLRYRTCHKLFTQKKFHKSIVIFYITIYHVIPGMVNKIRLQTKDKFTFLPFFSDRESVNQFGFVYDILNIW